MTVHVKAEPVMPPPDTPTWLTEPPAFCPPLRHEAPPEGVVAVQPEMNREIH